MGSVLFSEKTELITLNRIDQLLFVIEKLYIFCRNFEFVGAFQSSFGF
jgi:hypothetical protein